MGVSRFAMLSIVLLACGDNHDSAREHRGGPLPDAAIDAAIDARQYACSSEADCDPGQLCCLNISPGGAVQDPFCGPPSNFCVATLCDPAAASCTQPDQSPGACHTGVAPSPYDPRHWNLCGN